MARRRRRLSLFLASSSTAALLIGGGVPAFAACYSGPYPAADVGNQSGVCITNTNFSGNVGSTGTISPNGIVVINSSIGGQISTSGTLIGGINVDNASTITSALNGILIDGLLLQGGVRNAGQIASTHAGILAGADTFGGGISNGGTIMTASTGAAIQVGRPSLSGVILSSFGGGITNTGTLSAAIDAGIRVFGVSTFTGGIVNGAAGSISVPDNIGIRIDLVSNFSGGVSNAGTINAFFDGINVCGCVSTFTGGIANSGTITATVGNGIVVDDVKTFAGGISNGGSISAGSYGISIGTTTFSGGIVNRGVITGGNGGIWVGFGVTYLGGIANSGTVSASAGDGIKVTRVTGFSGGIVNSAGGVITASGNGIYVADVGNFSEGVSNAGTISANAGIRVGSAQFVGPPFTPTGIMSSPVSTFAGGIANSGTIAAVAAGIWVQAAHNFAGGITNAANGVITGQVGIAVGIGSTVGGARAVSSFGGGITNHGLIVVSGAGIVVDGVSTFSGGISNSGTISNTGFFKTGIVVEGVETFSGGIRNSGTIAGSGVGILVCGCVATFLGGVTNTGLIAALGTGMRVDVSTFGGGISNSGTISANGFSAGVGIAVGAATFSNGVSNSGLITAGGGFSGGGVGISVEGGTLFSGGIDNAAGGTIAASPGGSGFLGFSGGTGILVAAMQTFAGDITNRGTIDVSVSGIGIWIDNVSTFAGAIANSGTISAGLAGIRVGSSALTIGSFGGGISNGGVIALTQNNSSFGILVDHVSLFTGGVRNSGTIAGAAVGIQLGDCGCGISTFVGGITNTGLIAAAAVGILVGNVPTFDGHIVNSGTIIGSNAAIDLSSAIAPMTVEQNAGLIQGDINLSSNGDTLNIAGGTINGNVVGPGASGTVNFALGAGTFTYAAAFAMSGLDQANFNSGTAYIDGSIQATTLTVNNGGTVAGTGTLAGDLTVMSSGTLMPGNPGTPLGTINVAGSLTFNAGSFYAVHIAPGAGNNSSTAVTGTPGSVTISGGTVVVTPQLGHYNATDYVIVSTTGGRSGTFSGLTVNGNFSGTIQLDYTTIPGDVLLDVSAGFGLFTVPAGLNQNQQNVLNGINNAIVGGANLPPAFSNLANLLGPAFAGALTQFSGENAAGFFQGAFQAGNSFLGLMVNPFLDGRFGNNGGFGAAMGFAAEEPPALPQAAAAFASAMPVKAAPMPASFEQRFSIWGAAYGGSGRVTGDPVLGSHDTSSTAAAFAAGIDYRLTPDTIVGFALAGGGTGWNLTANLGGGHSDMFQAGAYASHHWGAAYVSGALAYNFHDVTTNRTLTIAGTDMLQARFQANGVGARLEGGYRYAAPWLGITPYGAAQVQSIALPNYGETATAGSSQFALNFASQTATTTRTELGAWLDRKMLMQNGALLTLYGRAAWAHDSGNTPAASAIFQALPGSNFVVNGAVPARDGALVTGAAQYSLASGWAFLAKFDGEFSSTTSIYSGSGMIKKTW